MRLFKKLQENSLYWQFRYFTRPKLAVKRWWRERRQPRTTTVGVRYRGVAASTPYRPGRMGGMTDRRRGLVFVLSLAVVWTAISKAVYPHDNLAVGLLRIAFLAGLVYLFDRFW
jgi:hypothetical protein